MSKREFLEILQSTLADELPSGTVSGHIQYYDQYISDEMRKGLSQEEVTSRLGDPRLIARTIIETSGASGFHQETYENTSSGSGYSQSSYGEADSSRSHGGSDMVERMKKNPTVHLVLGILIVVAIIGLIFSIVSALLPIVLPIVAVLLILSYLRKKF